MSSVQNGVYIVWYRRRINHARRELNVPHKQEGNTAVV